MIHENLPTHRAAIRRLLETNGIRAALVYINGLTPHRFTALYRFAEETLKKSYFYDKLNPNDDHCPDIPIQASYCIFLKETGKSFVTSNSMADKRVETHPKRTFVKSYCGVPLITEDGVMFGSVCHFDLDAVEIDDAMVTLMEELSTMIVAMPNSRAALA